MLNAHGSAVGSVGATGLPERSPRSCFGYLPPKSIERGLCSIGPRLSRWLPLQPWWQSIHPWWIDTPVYGLMKCWFYSSRTELTGKTKGWIPNCNCSWQDLCGSQKLVNENIFVSLSSFTASSGDEWVGDEGVRKSGIVVSSWCSAHPMSASSPALILWEVLCFHLKHRTRILFSYNLTA